MNIFRRSSQKPILPPSLTLFLVGGMFLFFSLIEIQKIVRLNMWGVEAEVTLEDFYQQHSGRGGPTTMVNYTFITQTGQRIHSSESITPAEGANSSGLKAIYLPSDPRINRLSNKSNFYAYVLLGMGLGFLPLGWYVGRRDAAQEALSPST